MPEHLDVLIIGAGLSGVGAAYHLQSRCPHKAFAILEARERLGGTWDLFRFPGIRSDSDMCTLGYSFSPWPGDDTIADGSAILAYIRRTAREHGIDEKIRYGHRVERICWSSADRRWTVEARRPTGELVRLTCGFVFGCTGYYRYERGYTPRFTGIERFRGRVVHPQHWTDDIDYAGKRVLVIGSGATAVTLIPAMAKAAGHVTMLQRSPSYVVAIPSRDPIASWLRRWLSPQRAYVVTRWKNILLGLGFYQLARRRPAAVERWLIGRVREAVGRQLDVDTHFTPRYRPWDQRLCVAPDGDLFRALRSGRASIVTDRIDRFTERGVLLRSEGELAADLIVTATGLELSFFGDAQIVVDGQTIDPARTMAYRGAMLGGVPNLAFSFGYTNASWTLRCDLTCEFVCRLLLHMDAGGHTVCRPRTDPAVGEQPLIDFSSGYVRRAIHAFPRQGDRSPWRVYQNYLLDLLTMRRGMLDDGVLELS